MNQLTEARRAQSPIRLIVAVAAVVVILGGMRVASTIVNMVLLALLISLLVLPIKRALERRGWSPRLAYTATILLVLAVTLLILIVGMIALSDAAQKIPEYIADAQQKLATMTTSSAASIGQNAAEKVGQIVLGVANSAISLTVFVVFTLIAIAYMLAEADSFADLVRRTVGSDSVRLQRVAESTTSVVTYMSITARINFFIALADMLLLWLVGVPDILLWGIVAFIFGFIPYVGYWISFIPPAIIAFGVGGPQAAIIVTLGYWLINGLVSQLVAPRLYGTGLNLSVTLTLISVLFWGWLLGSAGGILAVPLTAVLKSAVLANYDETSWLATILSDSKQAQPELAPVAASSEVVPPPDAPA